jgi:hypothetical protein
MNATICTLFFVLFFEPALRRAYASLNFHNQNEQELWFITRVRGLRGGGRLVTPSWRVKANTPINKEGTRFIVVAAVRPKPNVLNTVS